MQPEDISKYVDNLKKQYNEIETRLSDPEVLSNQKEFREISKQHQKLSKFFQDYDRWAEAVTELNENRALVEQEEDEEMKKMISGEIERLENEVNRLEQKIKIALLPSDPNEDRDIIVEIRPAAGGDESALFAGDLYRAYTKYAEIRGWKQETLDFTESSLGGVKEVILSLSGEEVYSYMKFESGVHRVQRVPTTESGGRIHTSTVTVAVLPEAKEVEVELRNEDLRFDYFRASGPGGQSVNTTDSAVRITHVPSGIVVTSQKEKSQHRNKATALRILRAKLFEKQQEEEHKKQADARREQIGKGERSERIRTYNFPQNRITDHRFGITLYNLSIIMEGNLDKLFEQIMNEASKNELAKLTD